MLSLTKRVSNGFNGSKSLGNPSSLLAKLVLFVSTATKQGTKPTRQKFMRTMGKKNPSYARSLISIAIDAGIIKYTGERDHKFKVLALGPNAGTVTTLEDLLHEYQFDVR